jgi:hypothetical protein
MSCGPQSQPFSGLGPDVFGIGITTSTAFVILTLIKDTSEIFPPLKAVAGAALNILTTVQVRFCPWFASSQLNGNEYYRLFNQIRKTGLRLALW